MSFIYKYSNIKLFTIIQAKVIRMTRTFNEEEIHEYENILNETLKKMVTDGASLRDITDMFGADTPRENYLATGANFTVENVKTHPEKDCTFPGGEASVKPIGLDDTCLSTGYVSIDLEEGYMSVMYVGLFWNNVTQKQIWKNLC